MRLDTHAFRLKLQLDEVRGMQLSELDKLTKDNVALKNKVIELENKLKASREAHKKDRAKFLKGPYQTCSKVTFESLLAGHMLGPLLNGMLIDEDCLKVAILSKTCSRAVYYHQFNFRIQKR